MARILRRVLAACDSRGSWEASPGGRWLMSMLDPTAPGLALRFLLPESALDS
ncbi:MAG: hypothetical protein ACE147_13175 [Candidatus Methylomirabilales bacterium]